ncbi:hypothetical protein H263_09151 [Brachyspira hampsonii 30599]|nr:hypothetical protein H263_09151 [Brachyspira hampsonii 30599]
MLQKLISKSYNIQFYINNLSIKILNIIDKYSHLFNSAVSIRNNVYNKQKLLKGVQTMNKKIFSIFIMVMALSLFGVSCNNKTTSPNDSNSGSGNNGGGTTIVGNDLPSISSLSLSDTGKGYENVVGNALVIDIPASPSGIGEAVSSGKVVIANLNTDVTSVTYEVAKVTRHSGDSFDATYSTGSKPVVEDFNAFIIKPEVTVGEFKLAISEQSATDLSAQDCLDTANDAAGYVVTVAVSASGYTTETVDVYVQLKKR